MARVNPGKKWVTVTSLDRVRQKVRFMVVVGIFINIFMVRIMQCGNLPMNWLPTKLSKLPPLPEINLFALHYGHRARQVQSSSGAAGSGISSLREWIMTFGNGRTTIRRLVIGMTPYMPLPEYRPLFLQSTKQEGQHVIQGLFLVVEILTIWLAGNSLVDFHATLI